MYYTEESFYSHIPEQNNNQQQQKARWTSKKEKRLLALEDFQDFFHKVKLVVSLSKSSKKMTSAWRQTWFLLNL